MSAYRFVVEAQVIEYFDCLMKRERLKLLDLFGQLAEFPHRQGDIQVRGKKGRMLEVKQFGSWELTYWTDDPVKEVRIVAVAKLGRRPLRKR